MDNQTEYAADQGSEQGLGIIQRLIGVLTSPRATFDDIAKRPTWIFPMILLIVVGATSGYFLQDIVWDNAVEQIQQKNPGMDPSALGTAETITRISTWAAPIVTTPLFYLVIAGLFLFTGNILLGGDGRFKQAFAAVSWSGIVTIVSSIINIPVMVSKGELNSATNLTFLAPSAEKESLIFFILSQFDLFLVWWVVVMGIGLAAIYKFTSQKGITVVAIWWVIYLVIATGIKALMS